MEIHLELNQRFGQGFQLRLLHGPMNKLYDNEPLTMYEAQAYAGALLDEMNRELGTGYKADQVVRVPKGALYGNAKTDFAAARVLQDIQTQKYTLSVPAGPDVLERVVDGENQPVFSGRGVILMAWIAWKEDGMPQARDAMRRYCEYISAHGYRGGASKAVVELETMETDRGARWVKQTYARHVQDSVSLLRYVLPNL